MLLLCLLFNQWTWRCRPTKKILWYRKKSISSRHICFVTEIDGLRRIREIIKPNSTYILFSPLLTIFIFNALSYYLVWIYLLTPSALHTITIQKVYAIQKSSWKPTFIFLNSPDISRSVWTFLSIRPADCFSTECIYFVTAWRKVYYTPKRDRTKFQPKSFKHLCQPQSQENWSIMWNVRK